MGVGVVRVVDAHPRVGARRQLLEFLGEVDLAVGRIVGQLVVPQRLLGDGDPVGLGQRRPFVDGAELHVVARFGEHLADRVLVERAGVGEAGATVADHPDADTLALRGHEVLDVALVDPHLGLAAASDERLDLLAGSACSTTRSATACSSLSNRSSIAHPAMSRWGPTPA